MESKDDKSFNPFALLPGSMSALAISNPAAPPQQSTVADSSILALPEANTPADSAKGRKAEKKKKKKKNKRGQEESSSRPAEQQKAQENAVQAGLDANTVAAQTKLHSAISTSGSGNTDQTGLLSSSTTATSSSILHEQAGPLTVQSSRQYFAPSSSVFANWNKGKGKGRGKNHRYAASTSTAGGSWNHGSTPAASSNGYGHFDLTLDPMYYWNNTAVHHLDAQLLAMRVRLRFPTPNEEFYGGLKYPLWRLIATGEDTRDNIAMLLGPLWFPFVGNAYQQWRLEALALPTLRLGSPLYHERMLLNMGLPRWSPREPTVKEQGMLVNYGRFASAVHKGEKHSFEWGA